MIYVCFKFRYHVINSKIYYLFIFQKKYTGIIETGMLSAVHQSVQCDQIIRWWISNLGQGLLWTQTLSLLLRPNLIPTALFSAVFWIILPPSCHASIRPPVLHHSTEIHCYVAPYSPHLFRSQVELPHNHLLY